MDIIDRGRYVLQRVGPGATFLRFDPHHEYAVGNQVEIGDDIYRVIGVHGMVKIGDTLRVGNYELEPAMPHNGKQVPLLDVDEDYRIGTYVSHAGQTFKIVAILDMDYDLEEYVNEEVCGDGLQGIIEQTEDFPYVPTGWVCPLCNTVYSPYVNSCENHYIEEGFDAD